MNLRKIVFWILSQSLTMTLVAQTKFLEPNLDYGTHDVGFKVYHEYDYSRTTSIQFSETTDSSQAAHPRPIQIGVWYPVKKGTEGNKMPFKRYIELLATQFDFDYSGPPLDHPFIQERLYQDEFISKYQLELALESSTKAVENSPVENGSFPLLVYSPGGYGNIFENATMFEYLASHGFIVASHSNIGGTGGHPGNLNAEMFEFKARDIEFTIGFMHRFPSVNFDQIGVLGFSFGGAGCLITANRHLKVKAFANLDGWINTQNLPYMNFVDTTNMEIPFLTTSNGSNGNKPNLLIFNSIKEDAYSFHFKRFGHTFFGSFWILLSNHDADDWAAVKGTQKEINLGYRILSESVLYFFSSYLNNDRSSLDKLKSLHKNPEIPDEFIEFKMKPKY